MKPTHPTLPRDLKLHNPPEFILWHVEPILLLGGEPALSTFGCASRNSSAAQRNEAVGSGGLVAIVRDDLLKEGEGGGVRRELLAGGTVLRRLRSEQWATGPRLPPLQPRCWGADRRVQNAPHVLDPNLVALRHAGHAQGAPGLDPIRFPQRALMGCGDGLGLFPLRA